MGMSRKTFTDVEDDAHSNPDGESADDAALRWMIRAKTEQRRALKAEKERDHLATVLETTARQRDEADKRNALPLTPDAITDEMIERARTAWNRSSALGNDLWRDVLAAALTEPPTRPEGAEELARLIATADVGEWDCGDLADALLTTGRVRVVSEDGAA